LPPGIGIPIVTLFGACVAISAVNIARAQAGSAPAAKWAPLVSGGAAALDRIAYGVDGAESSHGTDLRMWRQAPDGPQGPMQVSAAAAADVGGGDRFDEQQNRALGRAYLAQMYRRYGSWFDAVAAYNWGPGNMDSWISGGRPFDKLPLSVEQYRIRVLLGTGLGLPRLRVANTRLRRMAADPYNGRAAVALLYPAIISASDLALR
jgi:hypothetical protein